MSHGYTATAFCLLGGPDQSVDFVRGRCVCVAREALAFGFDSLARASYATLP